MRFGYGYEGPASDMNEVAPLSNRAVYDVRMSGHPARVSGTPIAVFIVDIENIFERCIRPDHVTTVRMQNGFWSARRAGRVKNVQRIFRVHHFGGAFAVCNWQRTQIVIPMIAADFHRHFMSHAFDNDHVLHGRTAFDRFIHRSFQLDDLPVLKSAVAGDDQLRLAVIDAALKRVHAEAAEDDRMNRADLGASQHRKSNFGNASHIDRDAVAFIDAHGFDDICHAADFAVEQEV